MTLSLHSPDGDEGYPGNLDVELTYTLLDGELVQSITATSDAATVINLAQHSYFNLAGHGSGRAVTEHELTLHDATHYLPVDATRIPLGRLEPTADTPFEFTTSRKIGWRIEDVDGPGWQAGYDHCFVLHGGGPQERERAGAGAAK